MATVSGLRRRADPAAPGWLERNVPSLAGNVKRIELIVFSRQMATFIRAGIPILDGIRVVREQTTSRVFRRTLDDIADQLQSGELLSLSLARHPRVFNRLYVDMILAAEATGELDVILDQLAKYLERGEQTSRRVRQAMLYPAIVLGLAAIVVLVLVTFVLPSFVALFRDFDAELPLPTKILLALGAYGGTFGVPTAAILLAACFLLYLVRDARPVARFRQRMLLHIPVVGSLVRLGIETRFARTLGILLRAGVPIAQGFDIASSGTGNVVYRRRLRPVREGLLAGQGITA
ncbi:MAG TPA: type II secretion system F family protein, partial [Candidatus Limnocylindrales bacterium]|nr:type II secretion system F family protein [Candidatus Limnocylindrales bacterium]